MRKDALKQLVEDLRIQTLVTKWMGTSVEEWKRHLELAKLSGYTAVHLTPIQQRGISNSPYSLRNHLEIDSSFFPDHPAGKWEALKEVLAYAREVLGLKVFTDVVWNHVSCDTPWLAEHPNAAYNPHNSPHLQMALELDDALMEFSSQMDGYHIEKEQDVDDLLERFRRERYLNLRLWEYFVFDVECAMLRYTGTTYKSFQIDHDGKWTRSSLLVIIEKGENHDRQHLRAELEKGNLKLYASYDNITSQIFSNLKGRLMYERVAEHGPKLGPISPMHPIQPTYFTRVGGHALANNGWIWNANPLVNFAKDAINHPYLTRQVIVWGDCVKVRYRDDTAIRYMLKYTEQMAKLFDGFRLDNCHSTPLRTAKNLLGKARMVNPQLVIVAELFTGSQEADQLFVQELGIDYLIREAMVELDPAALAHKVSEYSASPLGHLFNHHSSKPAKGSALFYDCTHDNPAPGEKRTVLDAIPNAAITSFSTSAIGSVRGYDELVPNHLNIVHERRAYDKKEHPFMEIKRQFYEMRDAMIVEGCCEVRSCALNDGVVRVLRLNPITKSGYCLLAKTLFTPSNNSTIQIDTSLPHHETFLVQQFAPILKEYHWNEHIVTGYECEFDDKQKINKHLLEMSAASVAILKVEFKDEVKSAIARLQVSTEEAFYEAMKPFDLVDYNEVFYKCPAEEYDSYKRGVYVVPGHGDLAYAGFAGAIRLIEKIEEEQLEYHPFVLNLRQGYWLMDYYADRLSVLKTQSGSQFKKLYEIVLKDLKLLPVEYSGKYAIQKLKEINAAMKRSFLQAHTTEMIQKQDPIVQELAQSLVKLYGQVPSTGLYPEDSVASLSAGLPHFSTHHMRCWGRDTFISFKGFFLLTLKDPRIAKEHLKAFAGCMHRGLIPNLLDAQRFPRYNARDATWFFLSSLVDYIDIFGPGILEETVKMRFNDKDEGCEWEEGFKREMRIKDIVESILESHWNGIEFKEWRAGPEMDSVMRNEGFYVRVWTDKKSGLVYGGNPWNCGTWMDKMGSAPSNHGVPSTSRHGANIEIIALLYKVLSYFSQASEKWRPWKELIECSFEKSFFNGEYYLDTLKSESGLRPNQLIAMAEAPRLFDKENAKRALDRILDELWDRGVRTLSPKDMRYRPIYDNSLNSGDPLTDHGANYHNGPQWLWLLGPLCKALKNFDHPRVSKVIEKIKNEIGVCLKNTEGVPELLNGDGTRNHFSCTIQAWSIAQVLEGLLLL